MLDQTALQAVSASAGGHGQAIGRCSPRVSRVVSRQRPQLRPTGSCARTLRSEVAPSKTASRIWRSVTLWQTQTYIGIDSVLIRRLCRGYILDANENGCQQIKLHGCRSKANSPAVLLRRGCFYMRSLAVTYSGMPKGTLPSAQSVFTSEFEMGSGGTHSLMPPGENRKILSESTLVAFK